MSAIDKKKEFAWILYDVGNSAFYTTVVTGFFPIFYKNYWAKGLEVTESSFYLGLANTIAGLFIALLAPFVGAFVDQLLIRTRVLGIFTFLGVLCTTALFFVPLGSFPVALTIFGLGLVGVALASSIYDSQLTDITSPERFHLVSAKGFSFGYFGGMLLFALNVGMTLKPELFGLHDKAEAVKYSFLTVAIWWSIFTIPMLIYIKDRPRSIEVLPALKSSIRAIVEIGKSIPQNKPLMYFLIAYWLYFDGVFTLIKMAIDYGMSIGFDSSDLIVALLVTQAVGIPSTLAFGFLARKIGPKTGLMLGIGIYTFSCIYSIFMKTTFDFYLLAITIGLVQGGVQSLSRSLYAHLIPKDKSSEYFGFFNMIGRFASILGPALMGFVSYATGNPRISMLSIVLLFVLGGLVLTKVRLSEQVQD